MLDLSQLVLPDLDTLCDVIYLGIPFIMVLITFLIQEVKLAWIFFYHVSIILFEEDTHVLHGGQSSSLFYNL